MLNSLLKYGYALESRVPVTLIGYSGGGQVALGAAPFLKRALGAPVSVVSLAGVMRSDPGLAELEHLYHLEGSKDPVPRLGLLVFPGRWPVFVTSHWNRLRRQHRLTVIPDPLRVFGPG